MARNDLTREQLEEALSDAVSEISALKSRHGRQLAELREEFMAEISALKARLAYYENPHSPPSADSLEWRRLKKERNGVRSERKPGGQPGHRGASRAHAPEKRRLHRFEGRPRCARCGRKAGIDRKPVTRDIVEIQVTATETRHHIQTATCDSCGTVRQAPNDLPKSGSYGRNLIGMITSLRAARVPFEGISGILQETAGIGIAKSTVINRTGRLCDYMQATAGRIRGNVKRSGNVGIDETSGNMAGRRIWAWILQAGKNVAIIYNKSRGSLVLDRHMDRYGGVVTSDKFSVYRRFDPGGRHQLCWAHELRQLRHAAQGNDAPLSAKILHRQVLGIYGRACKAGAGGRHSAALRRRFESEMRCLLFRYRDAGGTPLAKPVNRLSTSLPHLFTFLEYPGVDPTNNASERGLRHVVVSRKISGQIKGGELWMDRWSAFMTCVLTWRMQGKSLSDEVSKIV